MTVRYASTDAGAPVLKGIAGSLVEALDAILVDGYGSMSPQGWSRINSPTQTSGTATGGSTTSLIDTTVDFLVQGVIVGMTVKRTADGKVAVITSISTTTNPNDTLNFSSGDETPTFSVDDGYSVLNNRRIYRQPAGSNQLYLRVEDTGSGLITDTKFARIQGYETLTGFVTGKATGGSATSLIDTTKNFVSEGVEVGHTVRRFVAGSITSALITSITTTTNPNDTLNYASGPTFADGDSYCVDLGTGLFPTNAQCAGGGIALKSSTQNTTVRSWWLYGNGKIFHMVFNPYSSTSYYCAISFGDILSFKSSNDAYGTIIIVHNTTSYPNQFPNTCAITTNVAYHWMARSVTQTGGSIAVGKHSNYIQSNSDNIMGHGGVPYPHEPDSSIVINPVYIHEYTPKVLIRGILPGVWCPCHPTGSLITGDTFGNLVGLNGKTFEYHPMYAQGAIVFETSETW